MPLAAFTTLGVLGGGSGDLPQWMKMDKHEDWETPPGMEEEEDPVVEEGDSNADTDSGGSLLEEVIPLGAAAILPGSMGMTLTDRLDGIDNQDNSEDLEDEGPGRIFDSL